MPIERILDGKVLQEQVRWGGLMRPRSIVVVGDSITAGGDVTTRESGNTQVRYGRSFATMGALKANLNILNNAGVAGQTTSQILARFDDDVIAYSPDCVLIMAGTNNVVSSMSDAAIESMMQDIEAMVLKCITANILPIICTIPPKNSANDETAKVRKFYYELANFYRVPLVDCYSALVDPNDSGGNWRAGLSSDNVHPYTTGIAVMSDIVADVLNNPIAYINRPYLGAISESTANNSDNLIKNGCFRINSAGNVSHWGSVPATFTRGVNILDAVTDFPYNGAEVELDYSSGTGGVYGLYGADVNLTAGNKVRMSGYMKFSDTEIDHDKQVGITVNNSTGYIRGCDPHVTDGTFEFSFEDVVPVGATSCVPYLYLGTESGNIQCRNFTLIDVTAMEAVYTPGNVSL